MIREGRKLPPDVMNRLPELINRISKDKEIVALFTFGSLARGDLKPLSDLDFGILVIPTLDRRQRFDKHLELIGVFNEHFETDEIDLVLMNDAPMRYSYNIIKSGELLFCADSDILRDFIEKSIKLYLDFKYFRDEFDKEFLKGVGYYG
jgi:predicted nucleotidyltransferase